MKYLEGPYLQACIRQDRNAAEIQALVDDVLFRRKVPESDAWSVKRGRTEKLL